jgi:GNAT superfamily N-acetyltransferase
VTPVVVRRAHREDYTLLPPIEEASDQVFATFGVQVPAGVSAPEDYADAELVLVVGTPPVGFARVDMVDGLPHLEQISVHPHAARRGIGSALLEAAVAWAAQAGYSAMTLTTFRDLPFNGPFYARHGFTELTDLSPGLAQLRRHEAHLGLDDAQARWVMIRRFGSTRPPKD